MTQLLASHTKSTKSNKEKNQATSDQVIKKAHQQLQDYIDSIDDKITNRVSTTKGQFILAFQKHFNKIQKQLRKIRDKNQANQQNFSADQAIKHLTKQTALFRQQAMRLSNQLEDVTDDLNLFKRRTLLAQKQVKNLQKKLKQMMASNKKLSAEIQMSKRINQQQFTSTQRIKEELDQSKQIISNHQKVIKMLQNPTKNSTNYQSIIKAEIQTAVGNNTSTSSLSKRPFTHSRLKNIERSQAQKSSRYSNSKQKRAQSKSSMGYYLKTQQTPKNRNSTIDGSRQYKNSRRTLYQSKDNLGDEQFVDELKKHIIKIRQIIANKPYMSSTKKERDVDELLLDDQSVDILIGYFSQKKKFKTKSTTLLSADIMSKINGPVNQSFEYHSPVNVNWGKRNIKKERIKNNFGKRVLTSRSKPTLTIDVGQ